MSFVTVHLNGTIEFFLLRGWWLFSIAERFEWFARFLEIKVGTILVACVP